MRSANSMAGAVNHAPTSAWLQKFALFDKSFLEGPYDRPSGPEVACSQSLPSHDREGAVEGLSAYNLS